MKSIKVISIKSSKILITLLLGMLLIKTIFLNSFTVTLLILVLLSIVGMPLSFYLDRKKQSKINVRSGLTIIEIVLGASYLCTGYGCLSGLSGIVKNFHAFGYSDSFRYFIGIIEVLGGIGLVIKRLTIPTAIGLSLIMIGAIFSHIKIHDGIDFLGGTFYLLALGWVMICHSNLLFKTGFNNFKQIIIKNE